MWAVALTTESRSRLFAILLFANLVANHSASSSSPYRPQGAAKNGITHHTTGHSANTGAQLLVIGAPCQTS